MTYVVRPADIARDKQGLLLLWKRNFENINEKRYEWIYKNNPSGPPKSLLLSYESTGAIVGSLTLFPRNFYIQGSLVTARISGDMVVDRGHRSLGPVMKLVKAAISGREGKDSCFIYSFTSQKSEAVVLRVGFKEIGRLMEMTRVIRTYSYIQRYIPFPIIARAISFFLDLFIRFKSMGNFRKKLKSYKVEEDFFFNPEFDQLWKTMRTSFGFIGERSSQYLNWRFNSSPYRKHKVFKLFSNEQSKLAGYVLYNVAANRAVIDDFGFLGDEASFECLIAAFVWHQASQKIDSIQVNLCGSETWIKILKRNGFHLRSAQSKILLYSSNERLQKSVFQSTFGRWYLTLADNDI